MSLKKWKKLDEKIIFSNPWWQYKLDHFYIDSGFFGKYHYLYTRGSTMVVPINSDGKLILLNQYRYLNQRESLEFPCGGLDKFLSPEQNALKELREETGFSAEILSYIGYFSPFNGATNELCYVYIASNLIKSPLETDPTEEFEMHYFTLDEFENLIKNNIIYDGMTISSYYLSLETIKNKLKNV